MFGLDSLAMMRPAFRTSPTACPNRGRLGNRVSIGGDPMRLYEIMLILDPELEDSEVDAELGRLTGILKDEGASVRDVDRWGKRRFAYELKHQIEGYYLVLQVDGEPAALDEFSRVASLSDQVLRHKIVRLPEPATSAG